MPDSPVWFLFLLWYFGINPDFSAGFGIRRKTSAYFLLKKFLNTIKYSQTFLCVNILNFFVSVLKPAAKSGINGRKGTMIKNVRGAGYKLDY